MPRLQGDLIMITGSKLTIMAAFGDEAASNIILDTANTVTQINRDIAIELGLRTHRKLIGYSSLGDGNQKFNYLAICNVTILGVVVPLVVKIGDSDQPVLLGFDIVVALRMNLSLENMKFSILDAPDFDQSTSSFRFINLPLLMQQVRVSAHDLVPVSTLPLASLAYGQALQAGHDNYVLNLGTSCGSSSSPGVYVGTSYSTASKDSKSFTTDLSELTSTLKSHDDE